MRIGEATHPGAVSQTQQHFGGTGYRGIRIGETKHPSPSTFTGYLPRLWSAGGGSALVLAKLLAVMVTCVSACDGIGFAAQSLQHNNATIDRCVAFEIDSKSRLILTPQFTFTYLPWNRPFGLSSCLSSYRADHY
jgi:hypothetical protein